MARGTVYVWSTDEENLEAILTPSELSAALYTGTVRRGTGPLGRYVVTPRGQALLDTADTSTTPYPLS